MGVFGLAHPLLPLSYRISYNNRIVRMHTTLLSPFLKRVAAGCPCRERHGASVACTPPVRVGLLANADSKKVAVKSSVLLTSRDFALAEAWCFGNLPGTKGTLAVPQNTHGLAILRFLCVPVSL